MVVAPAKPLAPWARWGLVSSIGLMGAALIVTVWVTYTSVRDASETVTRGEADAIAGEIRARMGQLGAAPTDEDLAALVDDLAPDGLRYVASLQRDGTVVASAGVPVGDPTTIGPQSFRRGTTPIEVNGRIRVVYRAPRGRHRPPRSGPGRSSALLIELEPRAAPQLRSAARQTLGIGAAASGALLVIAIALVRWFVRQDRAAREYERQQRLASLGQMSAVLAHEIRNPLASLKGNAQILAKLLPRGAEALPKIEQKAGRVVEEATRLEVLTNDLLEFARAGDVHRVDADPAALLRDAAAEVATDDVTVAVDTSGSPATWSLDPDRIRQVLTNLLRNAAQAGPPVRASVTRQARSLVFTIRDSGPGFAGDDLPKVFEPFFTRKTRGTGLGLAVSKRLVELHGGTITAGNAPDGGAELRVSLPEPRG